jgi:A/G-specific adenine glycosylase
LNSNFSTQVVQWQKTHGRNDLPWQNTRDPYKVWLSEIMLQQTQVSTVLDYFPRFLNAFPEVASLAKASQDEVLGLWSGLGYYSRARNLHRCAVDVVSLHGGEFPGTAQLLQTLPGIGRSTAAAIASLCFSERVAILDGNVKRVLTRVLGFEADLASAANERKLWDEATVLLPEAELLESMPRYTQGVMDLGATICTQRKPKCERCPVASACMALKAGQPERFPVKTRKLKRSAQSIWLLQAQTEAGAVWLTKRPTPGVWAGLYCLPLFESREALASALPDDFQGGLVDFPAFIHVLTHKDLHLHVVQLPLMASEASQLESAWFTAKDWVGLGLPAPIRKLLQA